MTPPEGALIQVDNAAWHWQKSHPTLSLLADPKLALQELSEVVVPSMSAAAQQQAAQRRPLWPCRSSTNMSGRNAVSGDGTYAYRSGTLDGRLACVPPGQYGALYEAITATSDLLRTIPLEQPGSVFGNHGGGIGQGLPEPWE